MLTVKATQKSKRGENSKIPRSSRTSKASTASKTVKLTEDEIGELVLIALGDDELCDAIEEHERRLLALKGGRDPYANQLEAPNGAMIALRIALLVNKHYKNAESIDHRDLTLALRSAVLDQMVLPDHFLWGAVSDTRH